MPAIPVDLDAIPFVPARWYRSGRLRPIRLLVVHTPEFPELNDGAERLAAYFATTSTPASVHCTVDVDSIVRSVQDGDTAYGAENANADGLHAELVGYAGQSPEEWDDDYSDGVIDRAAGLFRAWGDRHGIPLRRIGPEQIANGEAGICSHADVYAGLGGQAYRWDPGPAFPWDRFMASVTGAAQAPEEESMVSSLIHDVATGRVYVYDPDAHSKTWLTGPPALDAQHWLRSVVAFLGGKVDTNIHKTTDNDGVWGRLLADAVDTRQVPVASVDTAAVLQSLEAALADVDVEVDVDAIAAAVLDELAQRASS